MTETLPPPRGIIRLEQCPDEGCDALIIGCDCATTTHLEIGFGGKPADGHEFAVTCDGCKSVHWLTLRAAS